MASDDRPEKTSHAYDAMQAKRRVVDDLLGGTEGMRKAGIRRLPQEDKEDDDDYKRRLERSFLFDAFGRTMKRLSSKPFSKPVEVVNAPESLEPIALNADKAGADLTQTAKNLFETGVAYGMAPLLVDFDRAEDVETRADELARGVRPTLIPIHPQSLIAWRVETFEGRNETVLTEIRWKETVWRPKGEFSEEKIERIRVYRRADWAIYEKREDEQDFSLADAGPHTFGEIPLVTFYTNRKGKLTAEPPLIDLAEKNVEHWQSASDQRNILRFARVGTMVISGVRKDDITHLIVGGNRYIPLPDPESKASIVETSGRSIEAGRNDLKDIEDQMERMGLQPLVSRSGDSTATGKAIDEANDQTDVEAWIQALESTLVDAYTFAARWLGTELPEDFAVNIYSEFGLSVANQDDAKVIDKARDRGDLPWSVYIQELKRLGVLSRELDEETMAEERDREQEDRRAAFLTRGEDSMDGAA